MTDRLLQSVVHPTDFSPAGLDAFAHALRLAVAAKSDFYILHIAGETEQADSVQFPRVRETLAAWGMIAPDAPQSAVASELGLRVKKAIIGSDDPVSGVEAFVERHQCDLLVLMTHARSAPETVSKLGVLCGTTLLAARRLGESNVVLFECSVHNGRPHLEHEVCSSR